MRARRQTSLFVFALLAGGLLLYISLPSQTQSSDTILPSGFGVLDEGGETPLSPSTVASDSGESVVTEKIADTISRGTPRPFSIQVAHAETPFGQSLQLTSEELSTVHQRQAAMVRLEHCPHKYLFVNTHTYGRHHNQLQAIMNLAIWANALGRTAVIGWFRFQHAWVYAEDVYNFTRIQQSYCMMSPQQMATRAAQRTEKKTAICLGQKLADTPLKKYAKISGFQCRLAPDVPAHYNTRYAMKTTKAYLQEKILRATEDLLVVSGQIGFFLRAGLAEHAAIFGLLRPHQKTVKSVTTFLESGVVGSAQYIEVNGLAHREQFAEQSSYFAIHLRQREQECMKEVTESHEDGGRWLQTMSADDWTVVKTQCAITVAHVKSLMLSLGLVFDSQPPPMFLGSDHQNMVLERALVQHGAKMYEGNAAGLDGLAVDFFVMSQGKWFTGNQLSSITQNICFLRLGTGRACDGFVPEFTRYHARSLREI